MIEYPCKRKERKCTMAIKKKSVKQPNQKIFTFGEAITRFWTKYIVFSGTAQRSEYWWWFLFNFLITLAFSIIGVINPFSEHFLSTVWFIATFIPWLALYSRRFHDAGFSVKWLFIPTAVFVILFPVLAVLSSYPDAEILAGGLLLLSLLALAGFVIFWFVVLLLPSKTKGNSYRK